MTGFIIGIICGLIIGWMIPQPQWVTDLWEWMKSKFRKPSP